MSSRWKSHKPCIWSIDLVGSAVCECSEFIKGSLEILLTGHLKKTIVYHAYINTELINKWRLQLTVLQGENWCVLCDGTKSLFTNGINVHIPKLFKRVSYFLESNFKMCGDSINVCK